MNELQLIRSELAAQRRHALELIALGVTSDAYTVYLAFILDLEARRIASHLEHLQSRSDLTDANHRLLGRCARTLETLAATQARGSSAELLARLMPLVEELEALAESRYALADWRRAAHIDADSILEERRLRKKVLEQVHGNISS